LNELVQAWARLLYVVPEWDLELGVLKYAKLWGDLGWARGEERYLALQRTHVQWHIMDVGEEEGHI